MVSNRLGRDTEVNRHGEEVSEGRWTKAGVLWAEVKSTAGSVDWERDKVSSGMMKTDTFIVQLERSDLDWESWLWRSLVWT